MSHFDYQIEVVSSSQSKEKLITKFLNSQMLLDLIYIGETQDAIEVYLLEFGK